MKFTAIVLLIAAVSAVRVNILEEPKADKEEKSGDPNASYAAKVANLAGGMAAIKN